MRSFVPRLRLASSVAAVLFVAACAETPTAPGAPATARPAPSAALAGLESFSGNIRIGVVPSASSVTIGSAGDYVIRDKVTGATLLSGTDGSAVVTSEGTVVSYYRLQVACGSASAIADWKARAEAAGYPTYTDYNTKVGCTRLYIGQFASNAAWGVRNAFRNEVIGKGLALGDSFWVIVASGVTNYVVTRDADVVRTPNPVTLSSSTSVVTIGGTAYRGVAEVRRNRAGALAGINEVPLEQYLYGVVPAELSPRIWPEPEAIKAQAVAARTYALSGLGKRGADGYDLLATTSDQVYGGLAYEQPMSNAAVDETAGIVATYDGRLISALYSSTSGGHTADNEEAYNSAPVPYLRGVPDAERGEALEHVPTLEVFRNAANPLSLRNVKSGDYEEDWARYHRWTFEWSAAEMARVASAFAGQDVGNVLAVNVPERGPSGRALVLEFVTDAGTFTATKDGIRSALKYVNASGTLSSLPSTLFFIEPVTDRKTKALTGFQAWGGGYGHGVGLSQTGAVGMAQHHHTYDEILEHYYQGITLERWN